jgi:catalase
MVLDRNPTNYFSETEQVAFMTQNVVPGIDFSNDPLLQGRNFSYLDTQLSRLGSPNFAQLPINAPKCPMMNFQRDGQMQFQTPPGRVSYSPSSLDPKTAREDPNAGFTSVKEHVEVDKLRVRPELFADHFSQARQFFFSQTETEQNHIISAFIFELSKVETKAVRVRMLGQLANVDMAIANRVADGLGMEGKIEKVPTTVPAREDLPESPTLSIIKKAKKSLKGKLIGCLIADGSDAATIINLGKAAKKAGANLKIISPKIGGAITKDGSVIEADFQLAGGPSVLFDCVFLALSADGAAALSTESAAIAFVHDAFAHLKVIGATPEAQPLLDKAGVVIDKGVITSKKGASTDPFLSQAAIGRVWEREPSVRTVF